jgi:hypothetical protein
MEIGFNPRARKERDSNVLHLLRPANRFNPRARKERDKLALKN